MDTLLQNYDYANYHISQKPMSCTMYQINNKFITVNVLNVFKVINIDAKKSRNTSFWYRY